MRGSDSSRVEGCSFGKRQQGPETLIASVRQQRYFLNVSLGSIPVLALIDTGSSNTVIHSSMIPSLQSLGFSLSNECCEVRLADGSRVKVSGRIVLPISVDKRECVTDCTVLDRLSCACILGMDVISTLGFLIDTSTGTVTIPHDHFPVTLPVVLCKAMQREWCSSASASFEEEVKDSVDPPYRMFGKHVLPFQKEAFSTFLNEWRNNFSRSPGKTNLVEHELYLQDGVIPIKQRYYPVSPPVQRQIDQEIDRLLSEGLIEPSASPWSSPILLVPKKNGSKRLCVDFRKLNAVTRKNAYPLPYISSILDKLKDSTYVSSIDLLSGFHQIILSEKSRPLTAFTVPTKGLFQYCVLPFGLHSAPASFQRLMEIVLRPLLGSKVFVYLDDILVVTKSYDEHVTLLTDVFERLFSAGLKINWDKCVFLQERVNYLGHIVGQGEILPASDKLDSIRAFSIPKDVKQLRSFLGLLSYYRRFINNFSTLSAPLTTLLKKNVKYVWTEECENSFQALRESLLAAPILSCPDFECPFEIQTDASDVGVGAVLLQRREGVEYVIAFTSRTLNRAERNYTVTEKECLAVLVACEKFRMYVEGSHFTVVSDHHSLVWLRNFVNPSGRIARWITRLSQYHFDLVHRKGKFMTVPDALSRIPYTFENENPPEEGAEDMDINLSEVSAIDLDFAIMNDAWYNSFLSKIKAQPEAYPKFLIRGENKIFKVVQNPVTNVSEHKLVVPTPFRQKVICNFHSSPTAGHFGVKKTYLRISQKYYWTNMFVEIRAYVLSCPECQQFKPTNRQPLGLMSDAPRPVKPGTLYAIDFVGPLPRSRKGNKYILTAVDVCTKFLIASPVRAATSQAAIQFILHEIVLMFGVPEIVLSDNGAQFTSRDFKDFCNTYKIKHHLTSLYTPQQNPVERYHRTMKTSLAIFTNNDHQSWDFHLKFVVFAMRTAVNESTGFSPAFLTFGRELRSPHDLVSDVFDSDLSEFEPRDYSERLLRDLAVSFEHARKVMDDSLRQQSQRYNLRRRDLKLSIDQLVWRKNFPLSSAVDHVSAKLCPKYLGPFRVSKVLSPSQYELQSMKGKPAGRWSLQHIKPVYS